MALTVHVAKLRLVGVDQVGNIVDKNLPTTTIRQVATSSSEFRVMVDPNIPSTTTQPDIPTYLQLEAAASFKLAHLDQTYIVTYSGS